MKTKRNFKNSQSTHKYCVVTLWSINLTRLTSIQFSSVAQSCRTLVTTWTAAYQASPSIPNARVHSNSCPLSRWCHQTICRALLLLSIFPSSRVFSNESVLHIRWPKCWHFSFNISPSNEYSGLIFFRMGWLDLLAVQGTLKNLLQHYSSKTSILQCSAFFVVQLSHPYMTIGKTIALTRQIFVGKVMSLLFNKLSRLVITFLPRSKCLNFMAGCSHHLQWFWRTK